MPTWHTDTGEVARGKTVSFVVPGEEAGVDAGGGAVMRGGPLLQQLVLQVPHRLHLAATRACKGTLIGYNLYAILKVRVSNGLLFTFSHNTG